jgi:drug/metabolite transporter (DMT)-like permease
VNSRKYLVLLAIIIFGSCGDVLLSRGMRDVGQIGLSQIPHLIPALANPWILLGIGCLLIFFTSYSTALSWADLTFVLPATAVGYVVIALLSHFFLHEQISIQRWIGILLIVVGVGFVAGGPSRTAPTIEGLAVDSSAHRGEVLTEPSEARR